ncbi:hypothetical protein [Acetobacter sp.]|uniref:hypothetical protein n=1 Tax=Acetobacter sp. TaxID=440 RepID=UPI0039EC28D2
MQHNNNICSAAKSGFVASFLVAAVALITIMFDNIQIEFFANADVLSWLLCGPGAIVLGPLFLLRSIVDRSASRFYQTVFLGLGSVIQLSCFFLQASCEVIF